MIVLAIHDGHDAGACLLRDGKIILHSSEERRRNIKNLAGFPTESVQQLFKRSGIDPKDVDLITVCGKLRTVAPTREERWFYPYLRLAIWAARSQVATRIGRYVLTKMRSRKELLVGLADFGLAEKPLHIVDHHATHAATAFYHRPWNDKALILTLDGAGDGICSTVSIGDGMQMQVIDQTPKFHSVLSCLYSAITAH